MDGVGSIDLPPNGANLAEFDAECVVVDPAKLRLAVIEFAMSDQCGDLVSAPNL